MGSQSDFKTMVFCEKTLKNLNVKYETKIISAHRTPDRMYQYAKNAEKNNIGVNHLDFNSLVKSPSSQQKNNEIAQSTTKTL